MPKRLTIEFVQNEFKKKGCLLLSDSYVNSNTKLDYKCPNRHTHSITWHNFRAGYGCKYCSILKRSKTQSLDFDFVNLEFEKENWQLVTKKYINNKQKLECVCPYGHKHNITWGDWQQGRRCPYCSNRAKHTIKFIENEFKKKNYILLSKIYKNAHQKLEYICPRGHKHAVSWHSWQSGVRCLFCFNEDFSDKFSGTNSWNWKGGISCEPYCDVWLDKEFKKSILERDNYQCQNLDCWQTSKRLTVHHIDYNKKNCRPKNLITLCNSCNSRANKNREQHQNLYIDIMFKRGLV